MTERAHHTDTPTLIAIGLVAYVIVNVVHEGIGHGGMCLAVGGKPVAISSAWWDGSYEGVSDWGRRAVRAGGTLANLALGAACVLYYGRRGRHLAAHTRYFVWLLAVTNLFSGAGYMMADPIGNFGDWSGFVNGLGQPMLWRAGLFVVGITLTQMTRAWGLRGLEGLVGGDPARARWLCWWPYFVGGTAFTLAGFMNPMGPKFALTSALATFGGKFFLALLPKWVRPSTIPSEPALALGRSRGWIAAGLGAAVLLFGLLARSIVFGRAS